MYYFTCISFAIRPSGRKSAIKLIELKMRTKNDIFTNTVFKMEAGRHLEF